MHSIRLNIEDSVFDKVIYFLKNLPINEVKIIDDVVDIKKEPAYKPSSIELHTKGFKFNREEANER
jgi:hypothetical protein